LQDSNGWRAGIKKEFEDMNARGVWRKLKRKDVPRHKRIIGCKWVFKKKKDGRYRARLCALGYSQVPREDFSDTPVVDDITIRVAIINMIARNWNSEMLM
jgi:hypothetical protein